MKQRLIASGLVFAVGFGIGLGLTWALLARGNTNVAAAPAAVAGPGSGPIVELPSNESVPEEQVEAAPASEEGPAAIASTEGTAPPEAAPLEEEADAAQEGTEGTAAPQPADDSNVAGDSMANENTDTEAEEDAESQDSAAAANSNAWWRGLAGKRCRVDLGQTRALSIRRGTLKDGDRLDWGSTFSTNPRLGLMYTEEENIVLVHGVATNSAGTPVAAHVTLNKQDRETSGVIALHTQGLKVTLHPVDGEQSRP